MVSSSKENKNREELHLDAQVDRYDIKDVMLDFVFYVNILPKNSWETMGEPKLVYSLIQLCMENKYRICQIGRLEGVEVDLVGVITIVDFKVIKIMDEKDPYHAMLGIDRVFYNYAIIYLKGETMMFEADGTRVVQPFDSYQGPRYTQPIEEGLEDTMVDQIYNLTAGRWEYYINTTSDGLFGWRSIQSFDSDSEEAMYNL